jgi:WD40 repeat protein
MNGTVATLVKDMHGTQGVQDRQDRQGGKDAAFYSDDTLGDSRGFPTLRKDTTASLHVVKKQRKWPRRTFLLLSAAALSAGTASAGYTAYRFLQQNHAALTTTAMKPVATHTNTKPMPQPTKPALPTMAQAQYVFSLHQQPVHAVGWSPDGTMLASGSIDAQLLLWNPNGTVHVRAQPGGPIRAIAWAAGGQQIAVGAAHQVTFLNPQSGTVLAQVNGHTAPVTGLAWSVQQPQLLVSGALDQKAIVWNTMTYRPQTVFTLHTSPIEAVSWASDGQTVGSSSHGGVVRVWNATSGQEVHGYYFDGQIPLHALAFAPTGMLLAVGGDDGAVRLWNGLNCQQQAQGAFGNRCMDTPQHLRAHTKPVRAAAWSPDGRFLATGGDDGLLVIWHPSQTLAPLLTANHNAPVLALSWSPDGKMVATAAGNSVTLWRLQ